MDIWGSINWWVGDYCPDFDDQFHYGLFVDDGYGGDSKIWDNEIYNWVTDWDSESSIQYFDFMWVCTVAGNNYNSSGGQDTVDGLIGNSSYRDYNPQPTFTPYNTNDLYCYEYWNQNAGMPFAWTGVSDMSLNESDGGYCYIGFQNHSPLLKQSWQGVQNSIFPMDFYSYLTGDSTGYHESIYESLDYASWENYDEPFASTLLNTGWWEWIPGGGMMPNAWWYNYMMCWGNVEGVLPYY